MNDLLLDLLNARRGTAEAITARELGSRLRIPEREVRERIRQLRLEGHLICSDAVAGFFTSPTPKELTHYLAQLRSRAREIFRVLDAQERAARTTTTEQLSLYDTRAFAEERERVVAPR